MIDAVLAAGRDPRTRCTLLLAAVSDHPVVDVDEITLGLLSVERLKGDLRRRGLARLVAARITTGITTGITARIATDVPLATDNLSTAITPAPLAKRRLTGPGLLDLMAPSGTREHPARLCRDAPADP